MRVCVAGGVSMKSHRARLITLHGSARVTVAAIEERHVQNGLLHLLQLLRHVLQLPHVHAQPSTTGQSNLHPRYK